MFQDFQDKSQRDESTDRIAALRSAMRDAAMDAFLVPHADEQQNEYLPTCAERLAWLTGFTGSAGFCIVTQKKAVLFVDGRYTLQASRQTDASAVEIESMVETPPAKWLERHAAKGMRTGFDPWLLTIGQRKQFTEALERAGASLVPAANLVDRVWKDRPPPPQGAVSLHPLLHAGRSAAAKLKEIGQAIAAAGADFCVLSDTSSVAWAFNLRGHDIAHIPVTLGFAVASREAKPMLFIEPRKLDEEVSGELGAVAESLAPDALLGTIEAIARGKRFLCDPASVAVAIADAVAKGGGTVVEGRDPCTLPRACKNEAEISGSRSAHLRDGVAMARFLAWLDRQAPGSVNEIGAATTLEESRRATAAEMNSELKEISFDTISGAGSNGAIVHYRVTETTNAQLSDGSLYLSDSGGQYADGTTDITRTVAIGAPPEGAIRDFTLVLKGHIAIATARFPEGTRGIDIDAFARRALWQAGKDYAHGTGHGVGAYLSVHEGPASISRRGMEPLKAGMIVSNEPGFYVEGRYGIRIENLVLVRQAQEFADFLEFETLTLSPIDFRLIDTGLLTLAEIDWLDAYHARVLAALLPHLDAQDRNWLENMCGPLG